MAAYATYAKEDAIFHRRPKPDWAEVNEIADRLLDHWGLPKIPMKRSHKNSGWSMFMYDGRIRLRQDCPDSEVVHELAHYAAHALDGARGHTKAWKLRYVEGIEIIMGDWYAKRLAKAFGIDRKDIM